MCHWIERLALAACCFALLSTPAHALAANKDLVIIDFGDRSRVAIHIAGTKVVAAYCDAQHVHHAVSVSPEVQAFIRRSDGLRFLLADPNAATGLAMMISTVPSTATGGTGYCGAGNEDHVVLLRKTDNTIFLADRYLLQSCLRSITLDADNPEDVMTGLSLDRAAFAVTFKLLGDPGQKTTTLRVRDGKFWRQ